MKKKKKKTNKTWQNKTWHREYSIPDDKAAKRQEARQKKADEKQKALTKKYMDSIKKREKQLDKIIELLTDIYFNVK